MIKINIEQKDNKIKKIDVIGHALYDDFGKDIVCAAVSSTVITTVNHLLSLEKKIDYNEGEDIVTIIVMEDDEVTDKLLHNMIYMLEELSKEYPKHLKIY